MKFGQSSGLDATDRRILELLQDNCKRPLNAIGEQVGLTAPSVMDRIHKLEAAGVIRGYVALLDARALGKDVTAFIGVSIRHPSAVSAFEREMDRADEVLECHHVTGGHTLMLKLKTENTASLERFIDRIRSIEGVTATETMIVLSTHTERARIALDASDAPAPRRTRRAPASRVKRVGSA